MSSETLAWLQDLSGFGRLLVERVVKPRIGRAVDYTDPAWREQVATAVARLHPRRMALVVREIIEETPSTKTLRLERTDGPLPPWRPGQYVNLYLEIDGVRTSRPYSISSPPGAALLDLTVRDYPEGFVAPYLVHNAKVDDRFETSGPAGGFYHEPLIDGDDLVFLAGGSGITPFMAILRDQAAKGFPLRIQLIYGNRSPKDVIYARELDALASEHDNFHWTPVISDPPRGFKGVKGLLDSSLLSDQLGELEDRTFYLCGPGKMYDLCQAALSALGVERQRIRRELYGPPADITEHPGWPEELSANATFAVQIENGVELSARAGEPLISSLERVGVVVPAMCRSGECSACRMRILSGTVFTPDEQQIRESDRGMGYVHACVAYPLEDLVIRL